MKQKKKKQKKEKRGLRGLIVCSFYIWATVYSLRPFLITIQPTKVFFVPFTNLNNDYFLKAHSTYVEVDSASGRSGWLDVLICLLINNIPAVRLLFVKLYPLLCE